MGLNSFKFQFQLKFYFSVIVYTDTETLTQRQVDMTALYIVVVNKVYNNLL